jgi:hypothetical protein
MTDVKEKCEYGHRLCEVRIAPGPSGMRLRHSMKCPDQPGAPIDFREYRAAGRRDPTPWRGKP